MEWVHDMGTRVRARVQLVAIVQVSKKLTVDKKIFKAQKMQQKFGRKKRPSLGRGSSLWEKSKQHVNHEANRSSRGVLSVRRIGSWCDLIKIEKSGSAEI